MPSKTECLRQKIGSCGGCEILEIVQQKSPHKGINPEVIETIAKTYCPEREKPVLPEIPKQSIW